MFLTKNNIKIISMLFLIIILSFNVFAISATGGTVSYDGTYTIHTFLSNESLNVTETISNAQILVVAGGGGAGGNRAGGGGAGGLILQNMTLIAGNYNVIVGEKGIGQKESPASASTHGGNSTFHNITAVGGGLSGGEGITDVTLKNGGSGGGANGWYSGTTTSGTGIAGQGYDGGAQYSTSQLDCGSGGGGGYSQIGSNAVSLVAGTGGEGWNITSAWNNISVFSGMTVLSSGGGGAYFRYTSYTEVGGLGGTGAGNGGHGYTTEAFGTNATSYGSGGGGGSYLGGTAVSASDGGNGMPGIVIVKYLSEQPDGNLTVLYSAGGTATGSNYTFTPPYNLIINATPDEEYMFINWTATGGVINDYLSPNTFITVSDYVPVTVTAFFNDEPKTSNMRIENIEQKIVNVKWENELDMEWISLRIGSDIMEVKDLTGSDSNEWNVSVLYPNYDYIFEWQLGDSKKTTSNYYNFTFRSSGWVPNLSNYKYKKLITVNHSQIVSDAAGYAFNLSLTEDNFQYFDSVNYVYYPAFRHLNYTTGNDIRFVDYYETTMLPYDVNNWIIGGIGGILEQTIPNATTYEGAFATYSYAHDGNWLTQATPDPDGIDYYNYTIPALAKTTSKFRIYDGAWGWDIDIPVGCFGGTDLQFKSIANTTIHNVATYCRDYATPTTWNLVRDNAGASYYIYETMVTWEFDSQADITVQINHFNDSTQQNVPGLDSDYDQKFWMYYGYDNAVNSETVLTPDGYSPSFIFTVGDEIEFTPNIPTITNLTEYDLTSTGVSINWSIDQPIDSRIEYATNEWILDSTWVSDLITYNENFEHIKGDVNTTLQLYVRAPYYISMVDVTSTNTTHSANYTLNISGTGPVTITFLATDDINYQNWTVSYIMNKTIIWSNSEPSFTLTELIPNTKYYYRVWAYGSLNSSANGTFTLGTPPNTSISSIYNYTEDRPNSQITVCGELTNMNGESAVNCSIQYFNEASSSFSETTTTEMSSIGTFCKVINVDYGHQYRYRTKCGVIVIESAYDCIGGTVSYDGDYTVHTFTNNGTLECSQEISSTVLVVAGGGGAGGNRAGGAGAGGLLIQNFSLANGNYNIIVGEKGIGQKEAAVTDSTSGGNSTFYNITAVGGGKSKSNDAESDTTNGGSGGGAGYYAQTIGQGTVGQGNKGGNYAGDSQSNGGGGGGGYSQIGGNGTSTVGGTGGEGWNITSDWINNPIFSGMTVLSSGGGGSSLNTGSAGIAGTGAGNGGYGYGVYAFGYNATSYGSGGGGGAYLGGGEYSDGGNGMPGVVIVRYLTVEGPISNIGYSEAYFNEFMPIQEFFAGSFIEDDMDYLDRQYCPNGIGIEPCYNQSGYREGSLQQEDWIWIESNIIDKGTLTVNWWDGASWNTYDMINDTDSNMRYLQLINLDDAWQTFYVTGLDDELVLNWTKPSLIHKEGENRTDESKYVSFGGTPSAIDYTLLYMDSQIYDTSAYRWCVAQGGSFYDCMMVQYWGGGIESGIPQSLSGTSYDRGQLFRGGVINGELYDTGILTNTRDSSRIDTSDERYCFAFTNFYWDYSIVPNNNITNYYYHYWTKNEMNSEYLGHIQTRLFDYRYLSTFEFDAYSQTRDWKAITDTTDYNENVVQTVTGVNFNTSSNQSLMAGIIEGFNADVINNDKIYTLSFYTDGRWTNQQFGPHQQAFVIFNLPDNATLAGIDSDNDNLTDFDELYVYYTNPKSNDTDEDGWADGWEITNEFDPNLYLSPITGIDSSTILPTTAYANDTLYGYCNGSYITSYNYIWYKNGVNVSSGNSIDINVDNYTDSLWFGDSIILSCQGLTPLGTITEYLNSTALIIRNTPPVVTESYILPTTAYANDTLYGYCNGTDLENDTINYEYVWYMNNTIAITGSNIVTNLSKNQNWILQCTAYDEYIGSSLNSSVLTISNFIPVVQTVNIIPITAYSNTNLFGQCMAIDFDINETLTFDYNWYEDGIIKDSGNYNCSNTTIIIPVSTGGIITYDGNYTVHTFITNGTFNIGKNINATVLVVAGGGGAGGNRAGGAGGGGLIIQNMSLGNGSYNVVVGGKGIGQKEAAVTDSTSGENSTFYNITAVGGGKSKSISQELGTTNGGSGGGAGFAAVTIGNGTVGQGNKGGNYAGVSQSNGGGGGGGYSQIGGNGTSTVGGTGGRGWNITSDWINNPIFSGMTVLSSGGGGSSLNTGSAGIAGTGGGNGGYGYTTAAFGYNATSYGSGGGGGAYLGGGFYSDGGNGMPGVVIVRYLTSSLITNITTSGCQSNVLYNITNNSMYHSVGSNWTLSCNANDNESTSLILNTSIIISDITPVTTNVHYTPTSLYINSDIIGYCNITHTDNTPFDIIYNWYANGTIIDNGIYIGAENGETNIANLTLTNNEYSKNIILSCTGYDIFGTGNTLNSSQQRVYDIITYNITHDSSTIDTPEIGDIIQLNASVISRDYIDTCKLVVNDTGTWRYPTNYVNTIAVKNNSITNYNLPFTFIITTATTSNNSNISWKTECNDSIFELNSSMIFTSNESVFNVKDTTYPEINITVNSFNINTNNISIISGDIYNLTYNITYTDYNLFAMEVNVSCDDSGEIYHFTDTGLFGLQTYNKFDDVELNNGPLEKCTFFTAVSDSHTNDEIPRYETAIINNGISFKTENDNLVQVIAEDNANNVDTTKLRDRHTFEFTFEDSKNTRVFTLLSDRVLHYLPGSKYPGHFIVWNSETFTGNWIDFTDKINFGDTYTVEKINDYEYKIEVTTLTETNELQFASIGGTLVTNYSFDFYIGGTIYLFSNNTVNGTQFSNYSYVLQNIDSYPGINTSGTITGTTASIQNISEGNYTLYLSSPHYFPIIQNISIVNLSQNITYNSYQSEVTLLFEHVKIHTPIENVSYTIIGTGLSGSGVSNATHYLNAGTYTINWSAPGYSNMSYIFTMDYLDNTTFTLYTSYVSTFRLYDEKLSSTTGSNVEFNISGATSVSFLLFCPESTQSTIVNTTNFTTTINCEYKSFQFLLTYGTTSYYRSFILTPDDTNAYPIYLIDGLTTPYLFNSLIADDLLAKYINPSIYVLKTIGNRTVQITADYVDIEQKIGAYLIENHQYIVQIHSDNFPVYSIGTYAADAAGTKNIRLYQVGVFDSNAATNTPVTKQITVVNASINATILYQYSDIENLTTSVTFNVYQDANPVPVCTQTLLNTPAFTMACDAGAYYNTSEIYVEQIITRNGLTNIIRQMLKGIDKIVLPLLQWIGQDALNWFIIILLAVIVIMSSIQTANITTFIMLCIAILFSVLGWLVASTSVLALATLVALVSLLKEGDKLN